MTHTSLQLHNDAEKATWKKFKAIAAEQNTDASKLLMDFIKCTVEKFEGKPVTLDKFTDPNYVPKPELFAPISKLAAYLLRLPEPDLENARTWAHQVGVYCQYYQIASAKTKRDLIKQNDIVRYEFAWQTVMAQK